MSEAVWTYCFPKPKTSLKKLHSACPDRAKQNFLKVGGNSVLYQQPPPPITGIKIENLSSEHLLILEDVSK